MLWEGGGHREAAGGRLGGRLTRKAPPRTGALLRVPRDGGMPGSGLEGQSSSLDGCQQESLNQPDKGPLQEPGGWQGEKRVWAWSRVSDVVGMMSRQHRAPWQMETARDCQLSRGPQLPCPRSEPGSCESRSLVLEILLLFSCQVMFNCL